MSSSGSNITQWVKPGDKSGEFKRQTSAFRDWVSNEPGSKFPAEKGRYHLYVSYACPWAHRTLIARKLKGLEDYISYSVVHWHMGEKGWRFPTPRRHRRRSVDKDYAARFTVPVLYDKVAKTIVSNESSEILRMLGSAFDPQLPEGSATRKLDLYPEALRKDIDEAGEWTYDLINNGVYKSGFATTQEAYERNVVALFEALDRDIRLFVTLIRFDPVYVQHFKCNIRDIRSGYPATHRWMPNLYWNLPPFPDTTNFLHIKSHYTKSHTQINPPSITPVGPLPNILPLDEEVPAVAAAKK
ncbi:hypothetical protein PG989_005928 [Apiospora arundinis]